LLPAPVWYRFFLNKEYGGLFSSLTTGLYLTFKVASMVEKVLIVPLFHILTGAGLIIVDISAAFYQVRSLLASVSALSHKDLHYGSHATTEQVMLH
jgi:hypothetical protein